MKRLAEVKDSLDIEVKQNFIDPLQNLCDKDLKEIQVPPPSRPPTPHSVCLPSRSPASVVLPQPPARTSQPHAPAPIPAPPEEAGGPPPGLRLQEEATGQDPR